MTTPLFKVFMAGDAPALVSGTLMSGYVGEGPRVDEFEKAFTKFVGAPYQVWALNSCTSALELSLYLAGVTLGSEVITTPMTCTATSGAIYNRGGKIVWADVDPVTGLIDPADVARKITRRTKAIMAVDWAGRSCDYRGLREAARSCPWLGTFPIIQDAAHNLSVDMNNRGDYVCWSFQAIKHLTTGDGGALLVPEHQVTRARLLRWYGLDRLSSADFRCAQDIKEVGWKYHMNDIAASIGLANLPHAQWVIDRHRENAAFYHDGLQGVPGVILPPPDSWSSWWLYCLLVKDRASFTAYLAERGIASSPVHRRNDEHTAFYFPSGLLPGVDLFARDEVAIPVGWWVSTDERQHIVSVVKAWAEQRARTSQVAVAA